VPILIVAISGEAEIFVDPLEESTSQNETSKRRGEPKPSVWENTFNVLSFISERR
jgi:hypothetical protein